MTSSFKCRLDKKPVIGVCKINPCSSATGPPAITGLSKLRLLTLSDIVISSFLSIVSTEKSSIGLLITIPIAPFSLCSHT